jgi:hypothetical protein
VIVRNIPGSGDSFWPSFQAVVADLRADGIGAAVARSVVTSP